MLIKLYHPDGKFTWYNVLTIQRVTVDEENGHSVVWNGSGEYLGYSVIESPEEISRMMKEAYHK